MSNKEQYYMTKEIYMNPPLNTNVSMDQSR
ncbi:Uncharacterised protein [Clostridioides difficile]|nr:Uncharacterised protein [Clostridioides difficile]SJP35697.1 Uncharacterised protein [Clostridioides difficile]SJS95054.1 Uncharacterised protein [Clostridioides difficile]